MKPIVTSSENSDWRIKAILFRDNYAMMETNWGALLGALLFLLGIFVGFKIKIFFLISIAGLVIALFSVFFRGRRIRRNWGKVPAHCIDGEIKRVLSTPGLRGGAKKTWTFQLLCKFELREKQHMVTPGYWTTFMSERRLRKFLDRAISPSGKCQLWVNPDNPLQAELIGNDIKDLLLHRHWSLTWNWLTKTYTWPGIVARCIFEHCGSASDIGRWNWKNNKIKCLIVSYFSWSPVRCLESFPWDTWKLFQTK